MEMIMTTGTVARKLKISKDRYFRLEESGVFPSARRTSTGKRFFLPGDVARLRRRLRRRTAKRS